MGADNRGPLATMPSSKARLTPAMKERRSLLGHMVARPRLAAGDVVVISLSGRITFGDGDEVVKKVVEGLLERGVRRVVIDLSEVSYMDSSGVDAVVRSYNRLAEKEGKLRLIVTTERIRNLFEITKLLSVIETFATEAEALRDF